MKHNSEAKTTWSMRSAEGLPLRVHHEALRDGTAPFLEVGALSISDVAVLNAAASRFDLASDPEVALAFAFALAAPRQGHIGVELRRLPERLRGERLRTVDPDGAPASLEECWPKDLRAWQTKVAAHSEVGPSNRPGTRPFVFQPLPMRDGGAGGILMTSRMWRQQQRLAEGLLRLSETAPDWRPKPEVLLHHLDAIYGPEREDNLEARTAASAVVRGRLTVITGGPGTGKTWGIKRVLAILLQSAQAEGRSLSVELAAPTGKAAVRMAEAMAEEATVQGVDDATLTRLIASQPQTLHKLLGTIPHRPDTFRHGESLPFGADVVVVDEASMIDVVMMRHLVEAIAEGKRLILLGDRDQLASVDAGTVLADLVSGVFEADEGASRPSLAHSVARLRVSHRFKQAASVASVAEGLQLRDPKALDDAVALLCGEETSRPEWRARLQADPHESIHRCARLGWLTPTDQLNSNPSELTPPLSSETATPNERLSDSLLRKLAAPYLDAEVNNLRHGADALASYGPQPGYVALLAEHLKRGGHSLLHVTSHHALLDALGRYRVLSPHRRGARGVAGLNRWLSRHIQDVLIAASAGERLSGSSPDGHRKTGQSKGRLPQKGAFWVGRPIMITRNSYEVGLRNGDVGLVVPRALGGGRSEICVAFPSVGVAGAERRPPRYISLSRLPEHETALAMTVHKSQGSQFERIALVLPAATGSPILTRELVYTGITRAKWRVDWVGSRRVLREAVGRDVARASGLGPLLWPALSRTAER